MAKWHNHGTDGHVPRPCWPPMKELRELDTDALVAMMRLRLAVALGQAERPPEPELPSHQVSREQARAGRPPRPGRGAAAVRAREAADGGDVIARRKPGPKPTNFSPKAIRHRELEKAQRAGIKLPKPSRYGDETPDERAARICARKKVSYARRRARDAAKAAAKVT